MWFEVDNEHEVATPALLVYPNRTRSNISKMLSLVTSPSQLCPHVKTHKCSEILRLFLSAGIRQFKCSTVTELQMVAQEGASLALLAMQPTGPAVERLVALAVRYPQVELGTIVDEQDSVEAIASAVREHNAKLSVFLDINNGMGRTGTVCNSSAFDLCRHIKGYDRLRWGGLHVYDGQIHDSALDQRRLRVAAAMKDVLRFRDELKSIDAAPPRLIVGGTPSFPIHAAHPDRICSPGTPVFWDFGYGDKFPDLDYLPAAVLATRVVSRLSDTRLCVDLGHKSVAAEMSPPRVRFLNANVVEEVMHSEEHLVIEVTNDTQFNVGDFLYAVPRHICPTVALHEFLHVVDGGTVVDQWAVTARNRRLSV